jgi:GntR family transcriptional regulator, histidine utilization repressor
VKKYGLGFLLSCKDWRRVDEGFTMDSVTRKTGVVGEKQAVQPLYVQIRRAISDPIRAGKLKPGVRIPSEHALMARFGASRMTVNKALSLLADEGLIRRHRKIGSFVAEPRGERAVFEIWNLARDIAAAGKHYAFTLISSELVTSESNASARIYPAIGPHVLALVGLHLADGKPVQVEERWINLDSAPNAATVDFSAEPPGPWLLDHVHWSEAEHTVKALAADARLARLLERPTGTALLVVERQTWNGETPVTFARLFQPGDGAALKGRFTP